MMDLHNLGLSSVRRDLWGAARMRWERSGSGKSCVKGMVMGAAWWFRCRRALTVGVAERSLVLVLVVCCIMTHL